MLCQIFGSVLQCRTMFVPCKLGNLKIPPKNYCLLHHENTSLQTQLKVFFSSSIQHYDSLPHWILWYKPQQPSWFTDTTDYYLPFTRLRNLFVMYIQFRTSQRPFFFLCGDFNFPNFLWGSIFRSRKGKLGKLLCEKSNTILLLLLELAHYSFPH